MTTTSSNNDDDFLSDEEILDDIYKKDTAQGVTAPPPAISTRAFEQDMVVGPVNVKPPVSRNNAPAKLLTKSEDGKPRLAALNTEPRSNNSQNNSGRKPKYYAPVYSVKNIVQDKNPTTPNTSAATPAPTPTASATVADHKPMANGRAERKDRPNTQRKERGVKGERREGGDRNRRDRQGTRDKEEQLRKAREEEIIRKREEQIMKIREEEEKLLEEERLQREEREMGERQEQERKFREKEERERRIRSQERDKQLARERLMRIRAPGEKATVQDLHSVIFSPTSVFENGEAVIVPRTRGGFTYGRIVQHFVSQHCYADNSVPHSTYIWRVVYPNPQRDNLFKDLPAAYVGKLPLNENEAPITDEVDKEREVGQKPQVKDLHNAVFSPSSKFAPNQIVLVPRSKGGFTYGRIVGECALPCRLDEAHKHDVAGYRVLVSPDNEAKVRKDVLAGNLGKLYLPEQMQAAMQAASEVASLTSAIATAVSRPITAPRVIRPPELPRDNEEGLEEEVGIMYPPATSPTTASTEPMTREVIIVPPAEDPKPKRGILEVPGLFSKTESGENSKPVPRPRSSPQRNKSHNKGKKTTPLIVIDGPNVAMKHGKKKNFSVAGLTIALRYYTSRGFDALAFVPEYMATRKAGTLGSSTLKLGDFMTVGDDLPALLELVDDGLVVLTPPQDYDDSYCIEYAKKHHACIVTNDRYNDHIDKQKTEKDKAQDRRFIRDHCISFTFVRDEFMPNPDFVFPQDHPGE